MLSFRSCSTGVVLAAALLAGCGSTPKELIDSGSEKIRGGDVEGALADFDAAVKLEPENITALQWRARMYEFTREYKLALDDYNEAIRLGTKDSMAYSNRAWIRATAPEDSLRDGRAALADMQRAIEMENGLQYMQKPKLAAVYAELGDFQNAIRIQEEYVNQPDILLSKDGARANLALYRAGKPARDPPKQ